MCLLLAIPIAGLADVFGQETVTSTAASPVASLRVEAAERLRGGLLGQEKFVIDAHSSLKHATLVLDPGWIDGFS